MKTPCEDGDLPNQEALNAYCGFPKGFTKHDWCSRFYIGEDVDGVVIPCSCACHKRASQGVLFGAEQRA